MKMAKASEKDIDAAGDLMGFLSGIDRGYYPSNDENDPTFFDEDDHDHLRMFYDRVKSTLDKAPGWPGRVIGGMCYVILYDKNQIIDPDADVIELHPRFAKADEDKARLLDALKAIINEIDPIAHKETLSQAEEAIAKAENDYDGK